MELLKKSFYTGISSLAFAISTIVTNKLFSYYYGPQGVTLLAHFQNLVSIFTSVPNDGINRGMIRFMANDSISKGDWNIYFTASLILNIVSFLAVLVFVLFLSPFFIQDFPVDLTSTANLQLLALAMFLYILSLFFVSLLMARQLLTGYSILNVCNNLLGLVLIWQGVIKDLSTALLMVAFAPSVMLVFTVYYYIKKNKTFLAQFEWIIKKEALMQVGQFVSAALAGIVFGRIVDFIVRQYLIEHFNLYETGLWQAVVKVSDGYTNIFNAVLGILIFTKISSILHEPTKMGAYIKSSLLFVFIVTGISLMMVWLFRTEVLLFLYKEEFVKGGYLMKFLLVGDLFKFPSFVLAFILQAKMKTGLYIFSQGASACFYVILLFLLFPVFGIEGMAYAHCIRFIGYFLFLAWLNRKVLLII